VQVLDVVLIKYPLPASAVKVEAVTTVDTQLSPAAVAATTPEVLNILFPTCPLIIFSYALFEYPAAAKPYLTVPTPDTSLAITPELETRLVTAVGVVLLVSELPKPKIALSPP